MKLLADKNGILTFTTSNGAIWSRPRLKTTLTSVALDKWKSWRTLYEIDEATKNLFPAATHLVELTPNYCQEDPLFTAVPCHIKEGTKHQLVIYIDDDAPPIQVKITKRVNWN